jgi:hypothetical protein
MREDEKPLNTELPAHVDVSTHNRLAYRHGRIYVYDPPFKNPKQEKL